jgi:DNA invertase Pin-like site-specific DNA recombinase
VKDLLGQLLSSVTGSLVPAASVSVKRRYLGQRAAMSGREDARQDQREISVLGYLRVSTNEQAGSGAGLAAQRAAIEAAVRERGWQLLDVVEDAGFTGRHLRRPGITAVLTALREGRADALMVAKLDRLSRSMLDFASLMDRSTKEGWTLVALDLGVDTSSPAGEAMAHVLATFAQFERRLISLRTKEALAVKAAQGVRLGRPRAIPEPIVRRILAERRAGRSLRAIAAGLDADGIERAHGGIRWRSSTIEAVLRSAERATKTPRRRS